MENRSASVEKARLPKLFAVMFIISACTFGGGFVIVSLMKRRLVDELHWLEEEEMLDYTAMAQACPGAIAVNAAVMVGWRVAGIAGMLTALVATVLPPVGILGAISLAYTAFIQNAAVAAMLHGMQAGVAAVMTDVVLSLGRNVAKARDALHWVLMAAAFLATYVAGVNVVIVIALAVLVGAVRAQATRKGGNRHAA